MRLIAFVALFIFGFGAAELFGQLPKLDANGDPLPPGAIARFGSARLLHDAKAVAFLDAKTIVSFGESLRVWDASTGKLLREQRDKLMDEAQRAAFSGDGKTLITIHRYNEFRAWDAATGKLIREIKADEPFDTDSQRWALSVSADGKRFASTAESGKRVHVWAVKGDEKLANIDVGEKVMRLALAPDGSHVAALLDSGDGPMLAVWDASTGSRVFRKMLTLPQPLHLAFSPESGRIAVGGQRDAYAVFTVGGQEVWNGKAQKWIEGLYFSPDSQLVLITRREDAEESLVQLIDSRGATKRQWQLQAAYMPRAALSPDAKLLAIGGGRIRVWDVGEGREIIYGLGHIGGVTSAAITSDGKQVVSAAAGDRDLLLWDITTAQEVRRFRGHSRGSTTVAVSSDGRRIVSSSTDKTVRIWDTATGKQLAKVDGVADVRSLGFVAGGDALALTWAHGGHADLVAVPSGRRTHGVDDAGTLTGLFPQSDGRLFMVDSSYKIREGQTGWFVRIWDMPAARLLGRAEVGRHLPAHMAISRDGRTFAITGDDGTISVWELATGLQRAEFTSPRQARYAAELLAFAPDGRTLVSADLARGCFYLWDVATGKEFAIVRGHELPITAIEFTPDGRKLITGSGDGTLLAWDMTLAAHRPPPLVGVRLSSEELNWHWERLRDGKAAEAYRSKWALAANGEATVAFLRGRFAPAMAGDAEQIRRWVGELDSSTFAVREAAERELRANVDQAEDALRAALPKSFGEQRRRINRLLETAAQPPAGDLLRELRAVEVLEQIGTKAALDALRDLTADKVRFRIAREAAASVARRAVIH